MRLAAGFVVGVSLVGCGGGATAKYPSSEWRLASAGGSSIRFGADPEPPIAGFTPTENEHDFLVDGVTEGRSKPKPVPGGSGIATYHFIHGDKQIPIGSVSHVDDTASFYARKGEGRTEAILLPLVGPKGEKLSRVYAFNWSTETLTPVTEILPRIERHSWPTPGSDDFVHFVRVEGEKDLRWPVAFDGKSWVIRKAPPGVKGFRMIGRGSAGGFGGWLAEWRQGGASFTRARGAEDFADPQPRWTEVKATSSISDTILVGSRSDGTCEAISIDAQQTAAGANCIAASAALTATLEKLSASRSESAAAARQVAEADYAKRQAEIQAANEKAAQKKKEADDKLRADWDATKREEPIVKKYLDEIGKSQVTAACTTATSGLRAEAHARLVTFRLQNNKSVSADETKCVEARLKDVRAYEVERFEDAKAARLRAAPLAPSGGWSGPAPIAGPDRSGEQRLKETFDYMYGSGRASSCPAGTSLCK